MILFQTSKACLTENCYDGFKLIFQMEKKNNKIEIQIPNIVPSFTKRSEARPKMDDQKCLKHKGVKNAATERGS